MLSASTPFKILNDENAAPPSLHKSAFKALQSKQALGMGPVTPLKALGKDGQTSITSTAKKSRAFGTALSSNKLNSQQFSHNVIPPKSHQKASIKIVQNENDMVSLSTTKSKVGPTNEMKSVSGVKKDNVSVDVDIDEMLCLRKSSQQGDAMGMILKKVQDKRSKGDKSFVDDDIEDMNSSFEDEGFDFIAAAESMFPIDNGRDFDGFAHSLDQNCQDMYENDDLNNHLCSHFDCISNIRK